MTSNVIARPCIVHPAPGRRWLLKLLGRVIAFGIPLSLPCSAFSQSTKEIEGINDWTKQGKSHIPQNGVVPDKKTALSVAEAILSAVYGEKQIAEQRPFKAALVDQEAWLVWGTLDKKYLGGTAVIKISRKSGKVIFLSHGQ